MFNFILGLVVGLIIWSFNIYDYKLRLVDTARQQSGRVKIYGKWYTIKETNVIELQ